VRSFAAADKQRVATQSDVSGFLRGALAGIISRGCAALAVFLFSVLMARRLGVSAFGIFTIGISAISVLAVIARMGLDLPVIRFAAIALQSDDPGQANWLYRKVSFVTAIAAGVLSLAWLLSVLAGIFPGRITPVALLGWAVLPITLLFVNVHFLEAAQRVGSALFVRTAMVPLFAVMGLLLVPDADGLGEVSGIYVAAVFVAWGISVLLWRSTNTAPPSMDQVELAPVLAAGRELMAPSLIKQIVMPWGAVLTLGILGTAEGAGLFTVANRIAALISLVAWPINAMLAPRIAVLWNNGDQDAFFALVRHAALLMLGLSLPLLLIMMVFATEIISMFGSEFVEARGMLIILGVAQIIVVLAGPVRSMLVMAGYHREHMLVASAGGVTLAVACPVGIMLWGTTGVALATALSILVANGLAVVLAWFRFGRLPLT